jgi:hypothetical protein
MSISNLVSEFDTYLINFAKECPDLEDPKYIKQKEFIVFMAREAA